MKPIDYIIIGALAAVIAIIVVRLIQKKKKGESGCGCGCNNCPNAGACGMKNTEDKEEKDV